MSGRVIVEGQGPLSVRGSVVIKTGTLDLNGVDLNVGNSSNTDSGTLIVLE